MGNMLGYMEKEKSKNAYIEGHTYNYYELSTHLLTLFQHTALKIIAALRCPYKVHENNVWFFTLFFSLIQLTQQNNKSWLKNELKKN